MSEFGSFFFRVLLVGIREVVLLLGLFLLLLLDGGHDSGLLLVLLLGLLGDVGPHLLVLVHHDLGGGDKDGRDLVEVLGRALEIHPGLDLLGLLGALCSKRERVSE